MFRLLIFLLALSACCKHKPIEIKRYDSWFMGDFKNEIQEKGCHRCILMHQDFKGLRSQVKECQEDRL